jgi:S1-C subfamily serine protease
MLKKKLITAAIAVCSILFGSVIYIAGVNSGKNASNRAGHKLYSKFFTGFQDLPSWAALSSLSPEEVTLPNVIEKTLQAVVCVEVEGKQNVFADSFFSLFFGPMQQTVRASGSGVIVNEDGYILTCNHVVKGATTIKVTLSNNRVFRAEEVFSDEKMDLAVLKISSKNRKLKFPYIDICDDLPRIGEKVVAVGNSFGLGLTVTSGIISAQNRVFDGSIFLQTDAHVNSGNSGGPIIHVQSGKVAGIARAIVSKSGGSHGVNFGVPAPLLRHALDCAVHGKKSGKVPLKGHTAGAAILEAVSERGINIRGGVVVVSVEGQGAKGCALKPGDLIIAFNGFCVSSAEEFYWCTKVAPADEECKIAFVKAKDITSNRKIEPRETTFKVIGKHDYKQLTSTNITIRKGPLAGTELCDVTKDLAESKGLRCKSGALVLKSSCGTVAKGDIILELNGVKISKAADVVKAVKKKEGKGFSVTVQRKDGVTQQRMVW